MNDLERLIDAVQRILPDVQVEVDPGVGSTGRSYATLDRAGHHVDIEWRPGRGFGITSTEEEPGYGEGPDETYEDWSQAMARVANLLACSPSAAVIEHQKAGR